MRCMSTPRIVCLFALLLATIGSAASPRAEAQDIPLLTVCDALAEPARFSGAIVAVHANVGFTFEGIDIYDTTCRKPFVTAGREWPNDIELALSKHASPSDIPDGLGDYRSPE